MIFLSFSFENHGKEHVKITVKYNYLYILDFHLLLATAALPWQDLWYIIIPTSLTQDLIIFIFQHGSQYSLVLPMSRAENHMVIGIVSVIAKGFSSLAVVVIKLRVGSMEKLQHTSGNPKKHKLS